MVGIVSASKKILEASKIDTKLEQAPGIPVMPGISPNPYLLYVLHKHPPTQSSALINEQALKATKIFHENASKQVLDIQSQLEGDSIKNFLKGDVRISYANGTKVLSNFLLIKKNLSKLEKQLATVWDKYIDKFSKKNGTNQFISRETRDSLITREEEYINLYNEIHKTGTKLDTLIQEIVNKVYAISPDKANQFKKFLCDFVEQEKLDSDFPYYREELHLKKQIKNTILAIKIISSYENGPYGETEKSLKKHLKTLKNLKSSLATLPLKHMDLQKISNNKEEILAYYNKQNTHINEKIKQTLEQAIENINA